MMHDILGHAYVRPASPEGFFDLAAGTRARPRLFLLDEADAFVAAEKHSGYALARAMRALKEEGRAYFVLAGYWELYAAAALSADHPLRNFGETLRLGPLDRESARRLVQEPMRTLRLHFEDPATIEWLLDQTGCRANLLAIACSDLVERLDAHTRGLPDGYVREAVRTADGLRADFKIWRSGPPLDRAVTRAALLLTEPRRADVAQRLRETGLALSREELDASLDRLELSYVLVPDAGGRLRCPVPLLAHFIATQQPLADGLAEDIAEVQTA